MGRRRKSVYRLSSFSFQVNAGGFVTFTLETNVFAWPKADRDLLVRVIDLLRELDANQTKPDAVIPVTPRQEPRQETT